MSCNLTIRKYKNNGRQSSGSTRSVLAAERVVLNLLGRLSGIATATRQFNLDNVRPNSIDGGGQIFYNGLSMGLEGSW